MKTLGILLSGAVGFGLAYMIPTNHEIAVAAGTLVIASGEIAEKKALKSAGIGIIVGQSLKILKIRKKRNVKILHNIKLKVLSLKLKLFKWSKMESFMK
jgi:hypothetical protein